MIGIANDTNYAFCAACSPAIKPKVTVKGVKEGTDYTISYADNVRPGTAKVIIKGKGKYTGSVEKTFKIKLKKTTAKIKNNALTWAKVSGAEKYRVYKLKDGKLKTLAEMTKNSININKLTSGKEYTYAVSAYINGEWTAVMDSDLVKVKAN